MSVAYTQLILDDFLNNLNYDVICLPPFNNNPYDVAVHARINTRNPMLTGKDLLRWNIEREAQRLQLHNRRLMNLATDRIWVISCTSYQRQQLDSLAALANSSSTSLRRVVGDTLGRISQIDVQQLTNNPLFDSFYNGTSFSNNNNSNNSDIGSLILPTGYHVFHN